MTLLDTDKKPRTITPELFTALCRAWSTPQPMFTINGTYCYRVVKDEAARSIMVSVETPVEKHLAFERAHRAWEYQLYHHKASMDAAELEARVRRTEEYTALAIQAKDAYEALLGQEPKSPANDGEVMHFPLDPELAIPKYTSK